MSIASELTRLQNAKAAIKQSLENKGATIDSSATLSDYPSIIDNLPSGGDNSEFIKLIERTPNTDIHIPNGTTKLGYGCMSQYGDYINFPNELYLPDTLKTVEPSIYNIRAINGIHFNKIETLLSLNFDDKGYGVSFFGNNTILYINEVPTYDVVVPEGYTALGNYLFLRYSKLKSILLPSTVTSLGNCCFSYGNSSVDNKMQLLSINLDNITSYGNSCLSGCTNLTGKLDLSKATNIGEGAFYETRFSELVLPSSSSYTNIKYSTFSLMPNIHNITIPSNITTIGVYAFFGDYSWKNGEGLTSITIPSSVTKIDEKAFRYQQSLQSITIEATTPPTLGSYAFYDTNNCPIYVPCESVQAYKTATNWSAYADRITCEGGADEPDEPKGTVYLATLGYNSGARTNPFTYDLDGSGVNYTLTGFQNTGGDYYINYVTDPTAPLGWGSIGYLTEEYETTNIKVGDTLTLYLAEYLVEDVDAWNGRGTYFGFGIDSNVTTLKVTIDDTNNIYTLKAL